jgi:hypothetical protein
MTPARRRAQARKGRLVPILRRERLLTSTLLLAAAFFAYRWATDLQRPGLQFPEGWRGFIDQGGYLKEATYLANLNTIPAGDFGYGPGYPLLAAPFVRLGDRGWPLGDPFMPINAAVWLLTIAVTYLLGRRIGGSWVGLGSSFVVMFATPLIGYVTLPWNTTAVLGALDCVILVALARQLRWWHGVALGAAIALAYSSRYVDALWVAATAATVLLARRAGVRSPTTWWTVASTVIGAIPTLFLHAAAFGNPFTSSYSYHGIVTTDQFSIADIPSHALQMFVSPYFFGSGQGNFTPALLSSFFLLLLAPLGTIVLARRVTGASRVLVVGMAIACLCAMAFYLSYWFTGTYGVGFGSAHFLKMWWPLWSVATVVAIAAAVERLTASSRSSAGAS